LSHSTKSVAENFLNQPREVGMVPATFSTSRKGARELSWDQTSVKKFTWYPGKFLQQFKAELKNQGLSICSCGFESQGVDNDSVFIEVQDQTKISPQSFYNSVKTAASISEYVDGPVRAERMYRHGGEVFFAHPLNEISFAANDSVNETEYQPHKGGNGYIVFYMPLATLDVALHHRVAGVRFFVYNKPVRFSPSKPVDLLSALSSSSSADEKQSAAATSAPAKKLPLKKRINLACQTENSNQLREYLEDPELEPDHWVRILGWAVEHGKLNPEMLENMQSAYAKIGFHRFDEDQRSAVGQSLDTRFGAALEENNPAFLRSLFEWMCACEWMKNIGQKERGAERVFERLLQWQAYAEVNKLARGMIQRLRTHFWDQLLLKKNSDFPLEALETLLLDPEHGSKLLASSKKILFKMLSAPESMEEAHRLLFKLAGVHAQKEATLATLDAWLSEALRGKPDKIQHFSSDIAKHTALARTNALLKQFCSSRVPTAALSAKSLADELVSAQPLETFEQAKALFEAIANLDLNSPKDRETYFLLGKFCLGRLMGFVREKKAVQKETLSLLDLAKQELSRLWNLVDRKFLTLFPTLQEHQNVADFLEWQIWAGVSVGNLHGTLNNLFVSFHAKYIHLPGFIRLWSQLLPSILDASNSAELIQAFHGDSGKGIVQASDWDESINGIALGWRGQKMIQAERERFEKTSNPIDLEQVVGSIKTLLAWSEQNSHAYILSDDLFEEAFLCLRHLVRNQLIRDQKFQQAIPSLYRLFLTEPAAIQWIVATASVPREVVPRMNFDKVLTNIDRLPLKGPQKKELKSLCATMQKKIQQQGNNAGFLQVRQGSLFIVKGRCMMEQNKISDLDAYKIMGEGYGEKYPHQAMECYLQALALETDPLEQQKLYRNLGAMHYALKDFMGAIFHLTKVQEKTEEECGRLAGSYLRLGLPHKAKHWAQRSLSLKTSSRRNMAFLTLVQAHIQLAEFAEAKKQLGAALKEFPKDLGLAKLFPLLKEKETAHLAAQK